MIHVHFQHFLKTVILVAFALFFIKLHATGDISKYINPKYELMSLIAAWVFIFLFFIQLFRIWENEQDQHEHCLPGCNHDHGDSAPFVKKLINYSIILFPLVTGFALSPTVLDSSIAAKKGTILPQANSSQSNLSEEAQPETDYSFIQDDETVLPNNNFLSEQEYDEKMKKLDELEVIEMENDIFASYYEFISSDPKAFQGRKIKVSGFVYKEEGFGTSQLVISRFMITHCVADASIIGLLTEFEHANEYKQDTWLEIEGTLDVTTYNGVDLPLIKATKWKVIDEPAEPYIYPILTKITE